MTSAIATSIINMGGSLLTKKSLLQLLVAASHDVGYAVDTDTNYVKWAAACDMVSFGKSYVPDVSTSTMLASMSTADVDLDRASNSGAGTGGDALISVMAAGGTASAAGDGAGTQRTVDATTRVHMETYSVQDIAKSKEVNDIVHEIIQLFMANSSYVDLAAAAEPFKLYLRREFGEIVPTRDIERGAMYCAYFKCPIDECVRMYLHTQTLNDYFIDFMITDAIGYDELRARCQALNVMTAYREMYAKMPPYFWLFNYMYEALQYTNYYNQIVETVDDTVIDISKLKSVIMQDVCPRLKRDLGIRDRKDPYVFHWSIVTSICGAS